MHQQRRNGRIGLNGITCKEDGLQLGRHERNSAIHRGKITGQKSQNVRLQKVTFGPSGYIRVSSHRDVHNSTTRVRHLLMLKLENYTYSQLDSKLMPMRLLEKLPVS